jgi:cytochrome P450
MENVEAGGRSAHEEPDLTDPVIHAQSGTDALWAEKRSQAPMTWQPPGPGRRGFWMVARHRDVLDVLRAADVYASSGGNVVDTITTDGDSGSGVMLPVSDGERHRAVRKVVAQAFSAQAIRPAEAGVRDSARRLVRDVIAAGPCDFGAVSGRIPAAAVCRLLGAPEEDHDYLMGLARLVLGSATPQRSTADTRTIRTEILAYFARLLARRRREPRDDVVSLLGGGDLGSIRLTDHEIVMNCYSVLFGGVETTRLTLNTGVLALARNPEQWARLRRGEVSVPNAAEEFLRWTSAAMHLGRTATRDTVLAGRRIRAGDAVTVWNRSANFDDRQFDRPGVFDLGRTPNRHVTFGFGVHFCLGAALARLEITAFLEAMRDEVEEVEIRGTPSMIYSNFLSGVDRLPVSFRPARRAAGMPS